MQLGEPGRSIAEALCTLGGLGSVSGLGLDHQVAILHLDLDHLHVSVARPLASPELEQRRL